MENLHLIAGASRYPLKTEESLLNHFRGEKLPAGPFEHDPAGLKYVSPVADVQGFLNILFDEENGHTILPDFMNDLEYLVDKYRRDTQEGSSRSRSLGLLINPLPMATICCSPPDRVFAFWRVLSFKIGKML